jgi:chromosome segregation ATPase
LAGVEQVTAAHEMLHQAYDRLSSKDRTHIDALLADYYQHHLTNQAVKDKIDGYPDDAAVRVNEMHSIFGTEVRDLTPELETYYQQYFTDRAKVVSYAESYQGEFTKRQQDIAAYDQQLSSLKTQIDSSESDLQSTQTSLGNERQLIARYPKSKDPSGYNALVQSYNLMVDSYNNKIATTKQLISRYNDLVTQRNAIAVQESELQQALNSQLTPATTQ